MNYALKWLPSPEYFSSNLESLFGFPKVSYKCADSAMSEDNGRIPHLFVYDNFNSECELAHKSSY